MKRCPYCGKEYSDEYSVCAIDENPLELFYPNPSRQHATVAISKGMADVSFSPRFVSLLTKLVLYFAAWGTLVFIVWMEEPDQLKAAPGFPMGLLGAFPTKCAIYIAMFGTPLVIIGGWALYGLVTWFILRIKTLPAYLIALLLFCILLALNMAGCNKMVGIASGIN